MELVLVFFMLTVLLGSSNGNHITKNAATTARNKRNVCGTDGVTYKDICHFLHATCHPDDPQMDTVFPMTKIPHQACTKVAITWERRKTKDCYIDFVTKKTYSHQDCEVRKRQCESGSNMLNRIYLHPGECGDCSLEKVCPWMPPTGKRSEMFRKKCAMTSSSDIPKCSSDRNMLERCCCFISRCTAFRKNN